MIIYYKCVSTYTVIYTPCKSSHAFLSFFRGGRYQLVAFVGADDPLRPVTAFAENQQVVIGSSELSGCPHCDRALRIMFFLREIMTPNGRTIQVRELFYNLPRLIPFLEG